MLGPREVAQEGFRTGKVIENALKSLREVGNELQATTAVFVAPPDFASSRANKSALKGFLGEVKGLFDRIVFEVPPLWNADEADSVAEDTGSLSARDPLATGLSKRSEAYYRLPGPAGHKSRYEDPAIEKLAEIASGDLEQRATYVFTNVDMFADAKRFRKSMKR